MLFLKKDVYLFFCICEYSWFNSSSIVWVLHDPWCFCQKLFSNLKSIKCILFHFGSYTVDHLWSCSLMNKQNELMFKIFLFFIDFFSPLCKLNMKILIFFFFFLSFCRSAAKWLPTFSGPSARIRTCSQRERRCPKRKCKSCGGTWHCPPAISIDENWARPSTPKPGKCYWQNNKVK